MIKIIGIVGGAIAIAGVLFFTTRGPDPDATPSVADVSMRTMSVFCPGLTLDECPSTQAVEVRQQIASKVAQGQTNRQIDAWLVANFGDGVLGRPPGASTWMVPSVVLLIGAGVVASILLRPRRQQDQPELSEPDARRFAQDFGAYEAGNE